MTQSAALDILKMGHNVFLTGSAGAGKTYVLNAYIKYLHEHAIDVAVTASTGIAATHMGGTTIHAWSGVGIRDTLSEWDLELLQEKKYLWDRYEKVKVLVIDEISMLSGEFLDMVDRVCRAFKRNEKPFGGIQVVLCGDLFQLPPIDREKGIAGLVVESNAWRTMNLAVCYLTEQHRQDDDSFLEILNAIRANNIEPHHTQLLEERIQEYDEDSFSEVTKLFTHNASVDTINERELSLINEPEEIFKMTGKGKSNLLETLKKSCLAPEVLKLKLGAQVMFVKNNFEKGYVNGTRGVVIDFDPDTKWPVVETLTKQEIVVAPEEWQLVDGDKVLASITQVPLRHAWAITVHKSQGMSLDAAVIDLSRTFAYGMGYVALSRVRKLSGVHLVGLSEQALLVDPQVLVLDKRLQQLSDAATKRIAEISQSEIKKTHEEFIIRSGGKLQASKIKDKNFATKLKAPKTSNHITSYELVKSGKTIQEVAKETSRTLETVIGHLEKCKGLGMEINFSHIKPKPQDLEILREAFNVAKDKPRTEPGEIKIAPIKSWLEKNGYEFDYPTIRLAKLFIEL